MDYNEIYENLKALNIGAFSLSKKDREYIRTLSIDLDIPFYPKSKCLDCYKDQIIILTIAVKKKLAIVENTNCSYKMVNDKSIKWQSFKLNSETITDELAEKFISNVKNWRNFIEKK